MHDEDGAVFEREREAHFEVGLEVLDDWTVVLLEMSQERESSSWVAAIRQRAVEAVVNLSPVFGVGIRRKLEQILRVVGTAGLVAVERGVEVAVSQSFEALHVGAAWHIQRFARVGRRVALQSSLVVAAIAATVLVGGQRFYGALARVLQRGELLERRLGWLVEVGRGDGFLAQRSTSAALEHRLVGQIVDRRGFADEASQEFVFDVEGAHGEARSRWLRGAFVGGGAVAFLAAEHAFPQFTGAVAGAMVVEVEGLDDGVVDLVGQQAALAGEAGAADGAAVDVDAATEADEVAERALVRWR